jgi:hypothetical protein
MGLVVLVSSARRKRNEEEWTGVRGMMVLLEKQVHLQNEVGAVKVDQYEVEWVGSRRWEGGHTAC